MDETTCVNLLQRHGIKPTSNRMLVVRALAAEEHPSSLSELEAQLVTIDKSGIFRALTLFRDHHLVHALEDGEGGVKYELCLSHGNGEEEDDDLHVHFYCERCHKIFCLYGTPVPDVAVPEGFVKETANFMIKGLCPDCAKKQ